MRRKQTFVSGRRVVSAGIFALVAACGGSDDDSTPPMNNNMPPTNSGALTYNSCTDDTRVGRFTVSLRNGFTAVQGQVSDAVSPVAVQMVTASEGMCQLLQPRTLFCDPACTGSTTCAGNDTCVPLPMNVSVGTVDVTGLTAAVSMTSAPPVYFYTHRGDLPHPGFGSADDVTLSSDGGDNEAFTLRGWGIDRLVMTSTVVRLAMGQPVVLGWNPPSAEGPAKVLISLNIANHGGTPGRVDCEVEDDGIFEMPVALTDQLLGLGFSGFPTVEITRQTADSTTSNLGCVEFNLTSQAVIDVLIPGLTSCSDNTDCSGGETCQPDLTCG